MKKIAIISILLLFFNLTEAQKYITKTGKVTFEASVPLFEDVYAEDNSNVTVINISTGDIASISQTKNFKFKVKLMEEHFNENYAESSKYPKVTFTGKVLNFDVTKLTSSPQVFTIQGKLNFHGTTQNVTSQASVYFKDGNYIIKGEFKAKPADYKVIIPKMVTKKVAEIVNVEYQFNLSKQ